MPIRTLARDLALAIVFSFGAASCADLDADGDAAAFDLADVGVHAVLAEVSHGADGVTAELRIDRFGPIRLEVALDAAGRGRVVLTGDDVTHEITISDTELRIDYVRAGDHTATYLARPRGDLLSLLDRYAAVPAAAARTLPQMPLHELALVSLNTLAARGDVDARWLSVARATAVLDDRFRADPSAAPPPMTSNEAWRLLLAPTAQPSSPEANLARRGPGAAPAPTVALSAEGDASPTVCPQRIVSGKAKLTGGTSGAITHGGSVTCSDGDIAITALADAGGGFAAVNGSMSFSSGTTSIACPSGCNDPLGGAECYKAFVTGAGRASLTGHGVVGDGGADSATSPTCKMKSDALTFTIGGMAVSGDATAGTSDVTFSAHILYEEDVFSDDICEAIGSGRSMATLGGGGAGSVCGGGEPPAPPVTTGDPSTDPRNR